MYFIKDSEDPDDNLELLEIPNHISGWCCSYNIETTKLYYASWKAVAVVYIVMRL